MNKHRKILIENKVTYFIFWGFLFWSVISPKSDDIDYVFFSFSNILFLFLLDIHSNPES